jgi:group I intron endonuclease
MRNLAEIKNWTIYKITNPIGQVYIGRTCNLKKRLYKYSNLKEPGQRLLHASLVDYGFENHSVEIIESFQSDKSFADGKEIFWIRTFMTNWNKWKDINPLGLNLCEGGPGSIGATFSHSEEAKQKISEKHKGIPNYKNRGIKRSEEFKRNISEKAKGHKRNVGRRMHPNTLAAILKATKGVKKSPEMVEKNRLTITKARGKAILQFDRDMNLINEFPALRYAERELGINRTAIKKNLEGNLNQCKKFIFKYK